MWDDEARQQLKNIISVWYKIFKEQPELLKEITLNTQYNETE